MKYQKLILYLDGKFIGNNYATGRYQKISNLIYEALGIK